MLKIMIVDDEMLSRIALRSMVNKYYNVVAEAADGEEAIELAVKTMPDIILVDVIMPGLDGLSFISQVAHRLPMTKYVIISNVEQVDYLKKAIKMKVFDYLIKGTLTEELLLSTLSEMSMRILQERQSQQTMPDVQPRTHSDTALIQVVDSVIRGKNRGDSELVQVFRVHGMELCGDPYYCVYFSTPGGDVRSGIDGVLTLIRGILHDCGEGVAIKLSGREIICFFLPPLESAGEKAAWDLAYRCMMTSINILGVQLVAGISQPVSGSGALQKAYLQARSASAQSFYDNSTGNMIFRYTLPNEDGVKPAEQMKRLVKTALQDWTVERFLKTPELLEQIRQSVSESRNIPRETVVGLYLDLVCYVANFVREMRLSAFDDLGEAIAALAAAEKLEDLHRGSLSIVELALHAYAEVNIGSQNVKQIKQYIHDHISEELRVEDIAEYIHVSPNYLSHLFKSETGVTLRDYIAAERITRAKDYLLRGESLRETALLTGFSTDSYFVQKFKAAVNMTPKQFQKKYRK